MACRVVPQADYTVSFVIGDRERLRWNFDPTRPRPCFFPLVGSSGHSLTRMGHPGAPNHDHHRSIWFGHQRVGQTNFWEDRPGVHIRQQQWLAYVDGPQEAIMAVLLGWFDADSKQQLKQELIASLKPDDQQGLLLDLQSTFRPGDAMEAVVELGQTNFGFLGVRVARSMTEHFGAGQLTNSERLRHEAQIFGQAAAWMDYSGPVPTTSSASWEGITYFDHAGNPHFPAHWHVREDGWMSASVCRHHPLEVSHDRPLVLRYLLHAHAGPPDADYANALADAFHRSPAYHVVPSSDKHTAYEVVRSQE